MQPEPYRSKFLSFTLLKITTNGKKKPDVEISTGRLTTALEFDTQGRAGSVTLIILPKQYTFKGTK